LDKSWTSASIFIRRSTGTALKTRSIGISMLQVMLTSNMLISAEKEFSVLSPLQIT
jgi:hypothetical protein